MKREDRWYVRFRGHTLGPLSTEQIKASVRKKELGPDDSLAPVHDPSWRPLRAVPDFFHFWEGLSRPMPMELAPIPPPSILWKKKTEKAKPSPPKADLPKAPLPTEVKIETQPGAAAVRVKTPKAPTMKAKAKAKPKRAKPKKKARVPAKAKGKIETQEPLSEAPEALKAAEAPKAPVTLSPAIPGAEKAKTPAPAPAATPAATSLAKSAILLNKEAARLLASVRDWGESEEAKPISSRAPEEKPESPKVFFDRPEIPAAPTVPDEPVSVSGNAEKKSPTKAAGRIELQLNLNVSKRFLILALAIAALAVAALAGLEAKKMRGPESFRLPDPSGPTAEPSPGDDPIPQLRAPTRPKRD